MPTSGSIKYSRVAGNDRDRKVLDNDATAAGRGRGCWHTTLKQVWNVFSAGVRERYGKESVYR